MPTYQIPIRTSSHEEILDITDEVCSLVDEAGVEVGLACISAPHCTCAVYVNENETGLLEDVLTAVRDIAHKRGYLHDRIDNNAAAHVAASIIGSSVTVPIIDGRLRLGTWQRVLAIELDGPRSRRTIDVTVVTG